MGREKERERRARDSSILETRPPVSIVARVYTVWKHVINVAARPENTIFRSSLTQTDV